MASPLEKFKVLIADQDTALASVSKQMLKGMGFSNIQVTPSGAKALALFKTEGFDFLITDWHLKDMDGIALIQHIRRDTDSPNPTMPVIMLTGRMEQSDVQTARDHGVHEYVVKPFSVQTIYNRLERIVEFPRYFVVGKGFVGPDRRHKQIAAVERDRRHKRLLPQRKPWDVAGAIRADADQKLWLPDFTLKHKLGKDISLSSIITPAVLAQAQAAIDATNDTSLEWIKNDVQELKALCAMLHSAKHTDALVAEIIELVLMISARSGTFGYTYASEVAYMLYLFCRKQFHPQNPNHRTVIDKHIDVLQFVFGTNMHGESREAKQVVTELKNLTMKYGAPLLEVPAS